ncbi:MAG TPA: FprA family A-type flavoprotein [Coriobacteriia bacterium]|nr:FprA family A-type flavoprotein [Coriobacteriia bacterium]
MKASPVVEGIDWVGAIDWNLRDFHGYETPHGTTYNAYLVKGDDKVALIDTVKIPFVPELLERIKSIMPLEKIDYIVVNHIEPDHNGGMRMVAEACPNAKLVASAGGVRGIAEYHGPDIHVDPVGPDSVIDLGGKTLRFLPMPMVHWPDSMFTYCPECKVLMPNDAFGQHVASSERFADELGQRLALDEMAEYYANILMPLGKQVCKAIEKVVANGWELDVIAPSHGVAWRGSMVHTAIDYLSMLASGKTSDKLIIAYSTMWGSTDVLAREIADGAAETGIDVEVYDLAVAAYSHIMKEMMDARALLLGSPTLHHGMLHRVAGFLQYVAGLKPADKIAGVFGSYGWSSGATKQMQGRLEEIGFGMPEPDFTEKFRPTAEDLDAARQWGRAFGEHVIAMGKGVDVMAEAAAKADAAAKAEAAE